MQVPLLSRALAGNSPAGNGQVEQPAKLVGEGAKGVEEIAKGKYADCCTCRSAAGMKKGSHEHTYAPSQEE